MNVIAALRSYLDVLSGDQDKVRGSFDADNSRAKVLSSATVINETPNSSRLGRCVNTVRKYYCSHL